MNIGKSLMKILGINTERRKTGDEGEKKAAEFLRKCGYKILEKNYVANGYEIDIIASRGDTLVFCEVKARTLREGAALPYRPCEAVTPQKQRKILRAATYYKGYSRSEKKMRFDVIEVYIKKADGKENEYEIKQLVGAFDKNTAYPVKFRK
ncbi:MAG: YraN family protein [Clostridia bacterium]|nr:YraN family protein [Clostridia bacterium]